MTLGQQLVAGLFAISFFVAGLLCGGEDGRRSALAEPAFCHPILMKHTVNGFACPPGEELRAMFLCVGPGSERVMWSVP